MGAHRKVNYAPGAEIPAEWPALPDHKGTTKTIRSVYGIPRHWKILDEIKFISSSATGDRTLIFVQLVELVEEQEILIRFGYYMVGVKGKTKGKWVWGQFCPFLTLDDFARLQKEMESKGWMNNGGRTV